MKTKHIIIGLLLAQLSIPIAVITVKNSSVSLDAFLYVIGPALTVSLVTTFTIAFPALLLLKRFQNLNYISIFFVAWLLPLSILAFKVIQGIKGCNSIDNTTNYYKLLCPSGYVQQTIESSLEVFVSLIPATLVAIIIFCSYKAFLTKRLSETRHKAPRPLT